MLHEEICTYEVCKLAKEKGFPQHPTESDGECYYHWDGLRKIHSLCSNKVYYDDEFRHRDLFRAPTQSILLRWLREEKNIDIAVVPLYTGGYSYIIYNIHCRDNRVVNTKTGYYTYELALEDALKYTLENLA